MHFRPSNNVQENWAVAATCDRCVRLFTSVPSRAEQIGQ